MVVVGLYSYFLVPEHPARCLWHLGWVAAERPTQAGLDQLTRMEPSDGDQDQLPSFVALATMVPRAEPGCLHIRARQTLPRKSGFVEA